MAMSQEAFEKVVDTAIAEIPQQLLDAVDNVAIVVEEEPPDGYPPDLLGLYVGIPLTERTGHWAAGSLPDKISIFRGPLTRMFHDPTELRRQIRITVVHELAHHFGIDDDRLHELGWG